MNKPNLRNQKLGKYLSLVGVTLSAEQAGAQINHVILNPPIQLGLQEMHLFDFDNDEIPEIGFIVDSTANLIDSETTSFGYFVLGSSDNGGLIGNNNAAYLMNCDSVISSNSVFSNFQVLGYSTKVVENSSNSIISTYQVGEFIGQNNAYVGMRFVLSGNENTHFGWFKVSVSSNSSQLTIHEYAYNAQPNESISVCQTSNGNNAIIDQGNFDNSVLIYASQNQLNVRIEPNLIGGTIDVLSLSGQIVKTFNINDLECNFSLNGISEGIYTVMGKFSNGITTKRIYIK